MGPHDPAAVSAAVPGPRALLPGYTRSLTLIAALHPALITALSSR